MGRTSKRAKLISLTKTLRKGKERKQTLVSDIRTSLDRYSSVFLFSVHNMRNQNLQTLRTTWRDKGRFFLGKNKVMQIALGKTVEEEYKKGLHEISQRLVGNCGLLFTDEKVDDVLKFFEEYVVPDYPRAGNKATHDYEVEKGHLATIAGPMEPTLRALGMPTKMSNGIQLEQNYVVCKKGDLLTPEQCRLLTIFDVQMAVFEVVIHAYVISGTFILKKEIVDVHSGENQDDEEEDQDGNEMEEDDEKE